MYIYYISLCRPLSHGRCVYAVKHTSSEEAKDHSITHIHERELERAVAISNMGL